MLEDESAECVVVRCNIVHWCDAPYLLQIAANLGRCVRRLDFSDIGTVVQYANRHILAKCLVLALT